MLDHQEVDKKLQIKLSGLNLQSFTELAQKMDSSIVSVDRSEKNKKQKKQCLEVENAKLEMLDGTFHISGDTSYMMRDAKKKSTIHSEVDINNQKVEFPSSIKYGDQTNNDMLDKIQLESSNFQTTFFNKQTQNYGPRGNRQITLTHHPQKFINNSKIQPNSSRLSVKKTSKKLSVFNTAGKLFQLFTNIKPLVTRYIENYTMFGRFRLLSSRSRQLIADKSDYIEINKKRRNNFFFVLSQFIIIARFIEKLFFMMLEKIPLFNPENKIRIMINAIIVCYNCFFLLIISFTIFFQANFGHIQHTFHEIATAAWITEMLIQMNTATYHDGDFITNRKMIFQIYLKEYFFFEILPLIFEGRSSTNTALNVLLHLPLLLKLKGMSIILTKLEFLILQHLNRHYIMQISKLLLQLLLLIHFMACSYITLAKFEQNILHLQNTWLENSKLIFCINLIEQNKKQFKLILGKEILFLQNLKLKKPFKQNQIITQKKKNFNTQKLHYLVTIHEYFNYKQNNIFYRQNLGEIFNNQQDWWNAYIEAQLWAFYTMGNSRSQSVNTEYEYAFTSFWMLISCVLFAYLINTLGNILSDINSNSENYKKDLNILNRYMKRKKIDIELQREMNTHLVKQYEQESQAQFDAEKDTLKKLSIHMRNRLVTESNKNLLQQFSFFKIFTLQTLQNVYQIMEEESYTEGQLIQTFEESTLDNFIYLILHGSVEIIQSMQINDLENDISNIPLLDEKKKKGEELNQTKKTIQILHAGEQFGEYEFFANEQMPYTIQSVKQATVVKISRKKLVQIVSQNKIDYQKFMETKQRISMYKQMNVIKSNCYICSQQNHQFLECNQVHLSKNSEFIVCKYNFSPFQTRDASITRKDKKNQKYIVKINSNILLTQQDDENETNSIATNEPKDEETSIYRVSKQATMNKKIKKEDSNNDEKYFDKQLSNIEATSIQKNIEEAKTLLKINTIGNNVPNMANNISPLNNRRSSYRASFIKRMSQLKSMVPEMSEFYIPLENKDAVEEGKISSFEEKNSIKNNISNISELAPQVAPVLQQMKSLNNNVTSLRAIRRSLQYNNPPIILSQLGNMDSEQIIFNSSYDIHGLQPQNSLQNQRNRNSLQISHRMNSQQGSYNGQQMNKQQQNEIQLGVNLQVENTIHRKQWNGSFIYWAFDKRQDFINFFPYHNYKNVLRNYDRYLKNKIWRKIK